MDGAFFGRSNPPRLSRRRKRNRPVGGSVSRREGRVPNNNYIIYLYGCHRLPPRRLLAMNGCGPEEMAWRWRHSDGSMALAPTLGKNYCRGWRGRAIGPREGALLRNTNSQRVSWSPSAAQHPGEPILRRASVRLNSSRRTSSDLRQRGISEEPLGFAVRYV